MWPQVPGGLGCIRLCPIRQRGPGSGQPGGQGQAWPLRQCCEVAATPRCTDTQGRKPERAGRTGGRGRGLVAGARGQGRGREPPGATRFLSPGRSGSRFLPR